MSFFVEYRMPATATSIRAISIASRSFFENIETVSDSASILEVAIAEGMNNVVEHAYKEVTSGEMRVVLLFDDGVLTVSIFDKGDALGRVERDSVPILPEDSSDEELSSADALSCEGRGRFIIASLMDSYKYQCIDGENCLVMTKLFS
ncbi:MAG: ATP-binding protein [Deltaproteobacteria bacterium]|nr:ATP-binding protein [Deltaproteobacteria bacterium]